MKRWATILVVLFCLPLLASCAARQQTQDLPAGPKAGVSGQPPAPASTPAAAGKGKLDSEEAILADLASEPESASSPSVADPLEPMNRAFFRFNDAFYIHVLDPAARGYKYVVPTDIRQGIKHVLDNLMFPLRMVSSLLQGKFGRAGQETARFVINTSMGVGGLGDASLDIFHLPAPPKEDLGQAMGSWGLGHGFYLVLPVLGPSSLRDGVGFFSGSYLDPIWYLPLGFWETAGIKSADWFNRYSFVEGEYADLEAGAVDPYVAVRDLYLQYRARDLQE